MNLLQFLIIITSIIFIFFGIDLYKRKRANILHFLIFAGGATMLIFFAINGEALARFSGLFGLARGGDIIVYISIVVLAYFYVGSINSQTKDRQEFTRLISALAIKNGYDNVREKIKKYKNITHKDDFIFNIRVYNESKVVGKVIDEIVAAGFKKLVLINDGSKDSSLEILQEKQRQYNDCLIIVLSHDINRGGGAANQTGYTFIQRYSYELQVKRFVGFDSDGQMDIKDMEKFMDAIRQDRGGVDAYLGSRFIDGGIAENMPKSRKFILAISRLVTRLFYSIKISDPHNGYRVIKIDKFKEIHLTADGMHYANEVNEQLRKLRLKYREIPVHINYTDYSLHKGQKNSNSIKLAMEMIYKLIFFR